MDTRLERRQISVVPDIQANSGGVTIPYLEWTQNLSQFIWEEDKVNQELR